MREPSKLPSGEACLAQFRTTVDGPTHHYQGWVRVAIYESGIWMQWEGDVDWFGVTWWEMAHFAHVSPPKLREDLEWERDDARRKGIEEAVADAKAHPELWMPAESPPARR